MKLELKHIAPYLPYELRVVEVLGNTLSDEFTVDVVSWNASCVGGSDASLDSYDLERSFGIENIKPILRPISSMTLEEIKELQDTVKDKDAIISVSNTNIWVEDNIVDPWSGHMELCMVDLYNAYEWLFKNHFDVFELIDKGIAIDKTKLK